MDSLTQITLGAAVGEAVLGKKYGNRAMAWGAVAGTIPDLDVIANLFMEEIPALAFHRAITHSLFFAVLWPFVFGYLIHWIYTSGAYLKKWYKWLGFTTSAIFFVLFTLVVVFAFTMILARTPYEVIAISLVAGIFLFNRMYARYVNGEPFRVESRYKDWVWLLFWATVTHPLLDCCTAYGTQLWQPFSDVRVAWNNISVADPLYTFPFLFFLIMAFNSKRGSRARSWWNWGGIIFSLLYMTMTVFNKQTVIDVFHNSLAGEKIRYERYMTTPTILNNVLWHCVAETKDGYYAGSYSLLEEDRKIDHLHFIPKDHHLIEPFEGNRDIEIVQWFANDYYNVIRRSDGKLQINDLRYGSMNDCYDEENDYIFAFIVDSTDSGELRVSGRRERGRGRNDQSMSGFWERIMGKVDQ
jgi:inner membrane protein